MKKIRAIKIDTVKQDIYEVEITPDESVQLDEIYSLMECNMIEVGVNFPNGDHVYVDEEGRFKDQRLGYFTVADGEPLCGHGLVLRVDSDGGESDALTPIDFLKRVVKFFPPSEIKLQPGTPHFISLDQDEVVQTPMGAGKTNTSGNQGDDQ